MGKGVDGFFFGVFFLLFIFGEILKRYLVLVLCWVFRKGFCFAAKVLKESSVCGESWF